MMKVSKRSVYAAREAWSFETTFSILCMLMTSERGRTAFTRKGSKHRRITLLYALNVGRVTFVRDVATIGSLLISIQSAA